MISICDETCQKNQFSSTSTKSSRILDRLRSEINKVVNEYIESGVAELMPGVLFIDEVHMLDVECFTYLYRALESPMAPVVVFATNRGTTTVRGLDTKAAHGIPPEMLDRLMIIPTMKYNEGDIRKILIFRAEAEGVKFENEAFDLLSRVGTEKSLRYALQLIAPAALCAQCSGREVINVSYQKYFGNLKISEMSCKTKVFRKNFELPNFSAELAELPKIQRFLNRNH